MIRLNRAVVLLASSVLLCCDSSYSAKPAYRNQSLKDWCDSNPLLKVVRRIISPRNEMFVTRDSALQVTHRWDTVRSNDCTFVVEAEAGKGLILNINELYLRTEPRNPGVCLDYLRIRFANDSATIRWCGFVNETIAHMPRTYVVPDGRVEVRIRIDDYLFLRGRDNVYVNFVFTQYNRECEDAKDFYCDTDMCIALKYVNDGNVNCPHSLCMDETSCTTHLVVEKPPSTAQHIVIGGIAVAVLLFVILPLLTCCFCEFCRKDHGRAFYARTGLGDVFEIPDRAPGSRQHRHDSRRAAAASSSQSADPKETPPPTYESLFPPPVTPPSSSR